MMSNRENIVNVSTSCRFCLDDDSGDEMITPCDCRGTGAIVHKHCLLQWLRYTNTCNVCQTKYKLQACGLVTAAVITHLNDILVDVTTIAAFVTTYCAFVYIAFSRLRYPASDQDFSVPTKPLVNQILTYGTICLGAIVFIIAVESFVKKFRKLIAF
ncbi:unnamed protein product [Medioppia subpectinata]|uniref:RING-CH-type domain-containing protein n=1 Tax=Medioppia subpectinata TaxID=1979941 RepID=A0A7R9KCT9_9ACAR|nr:unnamed protein product [Medioppia subpectinata]CAG2100854.1 unnamed protein product [Medioppia subpectinata]